MKRIISCILVFAMLLTFAPVSFAATEIEVTMATSADKVVPGGTFDMSVYVSGVNGADVTLTLAQVSVNIPEGFGCTVKQKGAYDGATLDIKNGNEIVFLAGTDDGVAFNNDAPMGTVTFTAPTTPGTYEITYKKAEMLNIDFEDYPKSSISTVTKKIIVEEESVEPEVPAVPELPDGYSVYVTLDPATINVEPGATFDMSAFVSGPKSSDVTLTLAQVSVNIPEGFGCAVKQKGTYDGSTLDIKNGNEIVFLAGTDDGVAFNDKTSMGTVTFTAPTTPGTYEITYKKAEMLNIDFEDYAKSEIYTRTAIVVVGGGSVEPPVVDPKPSLVVNPTAIEVPYGADVVEYIKANAKVYYYADVNAEAADVTADAVITEDGVVTYNGLTANIAVTKVTLVDIVLSTLEKIVVPYGTADVKTYVEAEAAKIEVTAKYSNNTSAVVPATVEYAGNVVTISYDGIAKTVEVEEIKAVAIGVVPNTDIVVPYGSDVAEYIKTAIRVQVETSNGEKVAPLGEVAVVDNGDGTATVTADGCEATVTYTIGANPEDIASIEVTTAGELVVPYGADAAAYIAANVTVTATKNSGETEVVGITAENVVAVDGVATITVEGCEATVNYTVETITGIETAVEALDLAWDADVEAAVKAVAVYYVYSANTANSVVPAEDIAYEIKDTEAVITVGEYTATIALNIAAKPAYFVEEVAPAYDLEGHKAIVISMNVEGVPYVNGVAAVKVADAKFVFVTDEEYTIEVKEETAEIVAWGTLHRDDMVTALDALMALNAADGVIADEFNADDNTYIKADIDLNYDITATDALGINNISLGKTTVVTMAE